LRKPVYGSGKEKSSGYPSMQHIQSFIRCTGDISNEVVFASKQNNERELCRREQRCTKPDGFIMLSAFDIIVEEFES
jgi:hypothetical protein